MNTEVKGMLALLGSVFLFGSYAIVVRAMVGEVPPMLLLFIRMGGATLCFLPFLFKTFPWRKSQFKNLIRVSLFSTLNVTFFIWGIQYTTASASQVIYALMPVLLVIIGRMFLKHTYSRVTITGVLIGLFGLLYIMYLSSIERGTTITGEVSGNLLILIAMGGWLTYLLMSKKLSKHFSPIDISAVSVATSAIISLFLAGFEYVLTQKVMHTSVQVLAASLYIGIGGTFLPYVLFQYAIKHLSSLRVSMSSYLQPLVTVTLAMIFLGEKLTFHFLLGSIFVFAGIFFASTLDMMHKYRKKELIPESL